MSTRQFRLTSVDKIKQNLPRLAGKKVNIVLTDRTVVLGKIKQINPDSFSIVNDRLKELKLSFSEISEMFFDTID